MKSPRRLLERAFVGATFGMGLVPKEAIVADVSPIELSQQTETTAEPSQIFVPLNRETRRALGIAAIRDPETNQLGVFVVGESASHTSLMEEMHLASGGIHAAQQQRLDWRS